MALQKLPGSLVLKLRDALKAMFVEDDFEDLLLSLDKEPRDFYALVEPYPRRIKLTIDHAQSGGWILQLVAKARVLVPADTTLVPIEVEIQAKLLVTPDVSQFQTCCLSGGHIMVNRATLRTALEKLFDPRERRILVVSDAAPPTDPAQRVQTGKSHTRRLISHLQQVGQEFELVEIDLETIRDALKPPKLVMPDAIAESIISQMGMKRSVLPKSADEGQWSRWNLEFCNNFVGQVKRDKSWWLVIDSFNVVLLPQESQDLIKELATRINGALGNLRMILLGYGGTFHPAVLPTVKQDPVKAFGEVELAEFFARAFKEKKRDFTEDDVADSVVRVLNAADPAQPDFLAKAASLVLAELGP